MFEPMPAVRVATTPEGLADLVERTSRADPDRVVLSIAPDEALLLGHHPPVVIVDPDALVMADGGWWGCWLAPSAIDELLELHAHWSPPPDRPVLAQGLLAGLPVKAWLEPERALLLVAHVMAEELAERLALGPAMTGPDPAGAATHRRPTEPGS